MLVNILIFCVHVTYMGTILLTTELVHAPRYTSDACADNQFVNESTCRRHCSLQNKDYLDIVVFSLGELVGMLPISCHNSNNLKFTCTRLSYSYSV